MNTTSKHAQVVQRGGLGRNEHVEHEDHGWPTHVASWAFKLDDQILTVCMRGNRTSNGLSVLANGVCSDCLFNYARGPLA
jgi:hypothetical protein